MSNTTWAVTCVNLRSSEVLSIDVFNRYEDACNFMQKDAQDVLGKCDIDSHDSAVYLEDRGQTITFYLGNKQIMNWKVMAVVAH